MVDRDAATPVGPVLRWAVLTTLAGLLHGPALARAADGGSPCFSDSCTEPSRGAPSLVRMETGSEGEPGEDWKFLIPPNRVEPEDESVAKAGLFRPPPKDVRAKRDGLMRGTGAARRVARSSEQVVQRIWRYAPETAPIGKSPAALRYYRNAARKAVRHDKEVTLSLVARLEDRNEFFNQLRGKLPSADFKLRVSDWRNRDVTLTHPSRTALEEFFSGRLEEWEQVAYGRVFYGSSGSVEHYWSTYYLYDEPKLSARHIERVSFEPNPDGFPYLRVEFNRAGTRALHKLTRRNIGERVALRVGNEVVTAPVIREIVEDGSLELPVISPRARNEPSLVIHVGPSDD